MSLIRPLEEEGLIKIENVGHLQHGASVFVQAKIQSEFQVIGENYDSFVTFLNGHVGNKSVAIGTSAVRVICQNTFAMAYADISQKFRHQIGVNEKVLETNVVRDYVNVCMGKYAQHVERLANRKCSHADLRHVIDNVFGEKFDPAKRVKVEQLFRGGRGNEGQSLYDAFNAITEFTSHEVRKTSKAKFQYVNFGTGSRINQQAFGALVELAR